MVDRLIVIASSIVLLTSAISHAGLSGSKMVSESDDRSDQYEEMGKQVSTVALIRAIQNNDQNEITRLLENPDRISMSFPFYYDDGRKYQITPIIAAIRWGNPELLEKLLEKFPNTDLNAVMVNDRNEFDLLTPMLAVAHGIFNEQPEQIRIDMARILMSRGALAMGKKSNHQVSTLPINRPAGLHSPIRIANVFGFKDLVKAMESRGELIKKAN